jgi:capsular polysaccharide biosynthesis protein
MPAPSLAVLAVLAAANSDTESLGAQQGLAEAAVDRSRVQRGALFAAPARARPRPPAPASTLPPAGTHCKHRLLLLASVSRPVARAAVGVGVGVDD